MPAQHRCSRRRPDLRRGGHRARRDPARSRVRPDIAGRGLPAPARRSGAHRARGRARQAAQQLALEGIAAGHDNQAVVARYCAEVPTAQSTSPACWSSRWEGQVGLQSVHPGPVVTATTRRCPMRLWIQHLRTRTHEVCPLGEGGIGEAASRGLRRPRSRRLRRRVVRRAGGPAVRTRRAGGRRTSAAM